MATEPLKEKWKDYSEIRLWQAVLLNALIEAIKNNDFEYFNKKSRGFLEVCELARIDHIWFIDKIDKIDKISLIEKINFLRRIRRGENNLS